MPDSEHEQSNPPDGASGRQESDLERAHQSRPGRETEPVVEPAAETDSWLCAECSHANGGGDLFCDACGAIRSQEPIIADLVGGPSHNAPYAAGESSSGVSLRVLLATVGIVAVAIGVGLLAPVIGVVVFMVVLPVLVITLLPLGKGRGGLWGGLALIVALWIVGGLFAWQLYQSFLPGD